MQVGCVLQRLLFSELGVLAAALDLDHCHGLAIEQQGVVGELVTGVGALGLSDLRRAGDGRDVDVELFDDWLVSFTFQPASLSFSPMRARLRPREISPTFELL